MYKIIIRIIAASILLAASVPARAGIICTLVTDARSGSTVYENGDCDSRVTPASTFKVPLAIMGYDSGFLKNRDEPRLPFVEGYADWVAEWRQAAGPARWMEHSIVWYSREIVKFLGADTFARYTRAFDYGNADVSGDPGQNNGLNRSWISSSLKISPREQTRFISRLLSRSLPVSPSAIERTLMITQSHDAGDGWTFWGKTGSAYPRHANGNFDRSREWGWYVGWAAKGDRLLILARLHQSENAGEPSGGRHTRDHLIAEWPALAASF